MAAAYARPKDSGNFLSHDMSPVDPVTTKVATANPIYEPSTGSPRREFKRTNHVAIGIDGSVGMMEHTVKTGLTESVALPEARRQRPAEQVEVAQRANEFFQGKQSQPMVRTNPVGINLMFDNPDVAAQRMADQKAREKQYSDANWEAIQDRRRAARDNRRDPVPNDTSDPWERARPKVGLNDRVPRKAAASSGLMFQQADGDSYVAAAFGKAGAGAPRRRPDGQPDPSRPGIFEKNQPFDSGPATSYVGMYMGKHRNVSEDPAANRRKPAERDQPGEYFDKFMGQAQHRTSSGRIQAQRIKKDVAFDTQSGANDFFGPSFGQKPRAQARIGINQQLQRESNQQPGTFMDRMKAIESQHAQQKPLSVQRDEEFSVAFQRARGGGRTKPTGPQ